MKSLLLFAVLVTLPLLLGGCGKEEPMAETKPVEELEVREGLVYIKGSDALYTGTNSVFYENGQKRAELNFKEGKADGLNVEWYENGQKKKESNKKDGRRHGLNVEWYENGKKSQEGNWKDDKQNGVTMMLSLIHI